MLLELQMRLDNEIPDEVRDEIEQAKLVNDEGNFNIDKYMTANNLWQYTPMTVDISTAVPFMKLDAIHTQLYLADFGMVLTAKIEYERYKKIREAVTGQTVKSEQDFKIK